MRLLILPLLALTGCASVTANHTPGDSMRTKKSFYVDYEGKKDLDVVVVEELRSRGYQAVSARSGAPVEKYDAVITCYDRWCWDITPYLMELQLKVVDPKTQSLVACGESYRPTFQRARPSTVVKQTLQAMLDTPPRQAL